MEVNLKQLGIIFSITLASVLSSCDDNEVTSSDPCANITCQIGEICIDGTCSCPDGYTGTNCELFDSAKVQFLLDGGKTPLELINGNVPLDSLYGKTYEGGLIFYLNPADGTGMVATPIESQNFWSVWGCYVEEIDGAEGTAIGTGAQNTKEIIAGCNTKGIAAHICDELNKNNKDDWFLPSKDELNLIYTNLKVKGHGGFNPFTYWSSTEASIYGVWIQDFANGDQGAKDKQNNQSTLAARSF